MNRMHIFTVVIALAVAAPVAQSQWNPIVRPPAAPTSLTPVTGTYEGRAVAPLTPLRLTWTQHIPSGMTVNPPATHFVICFAPYSGATAPTCTTSAASWTEIIAAPSSALTRTPIPGSSAFSYAFNPSRFIANTELDRKMRLTLGACSQLVNSSCRFVGQDLYFSSMNFLAEGPGIDRDMLDWKLNITASNLGTTDIQQFGGAAEIFEVLYRGNPGRTCDTDVDGLAVRDDPTLIAIDQKGAQTLVTSLPRGADGRYSGSTPIVGVFRIGNFSRSGFFAGFFSNVQPLRAGATGTIVGQVSFSVPVGAVQRPFVVLTTLDPANTVREFNETDNKHAQCKVR